MKRFLDTNSWIALSLKTHPDHAKLQTWYEATSLGAGDLILCRATEISFLRLITQAAVMKRCGVEALTNDEAIAFLAKLLTDPAVCHVEEPAAVGDRWLELASGTVPAPNRWMDAYLAAMALELGAEFVTLDRGFEQFRAAGLQLRLLATD